MTAPTVSGSVVVDPFAGSGNTLYWIKRRVSAQRGVGFELDDAVFEASRRNLSIAGLDIALSHEGHEAGLTAAMFEWSAPKRYDIDAPGRNHGLLLGTLGWAAAAAAT